MHQNHSYGRSGTLQATALRCVMQEPSDGSSCTTTSKFTPGSFLRSVTTLTQDDLHHDHHKRTVTHRPESLIEVKRKSDPSQERNKSFSVLKDSLLLGAPDGFLAKLGSGKASPTAVLAAAAAANARRRKDVTRKPSKLLESDPKWHEKELKLLEKDLKLHEKDQKSLEKEGFGSSKSTIVYRKLSKAHEKERKSYEKDPKLLEKDSKLHSRDSKILVKAPKLPEKDSKLHEKDPKLHERDPKLHSRDSKILEKDPKRHSKDIKLPEKDHILLYKDPMASKKSSKQPGKEANATFYAFSDNRPDGEKNRRASTNSKNMLKGEKNWGFARGASKTTTKLSDNKGFSPTSKGYIAISKGSSATQRVNDDSKGATKGVNECQRVDKGVNVPKSDANSSGRRKSTRRKFFGGKSNCTDGGTTTDEEVDVGGAGGDNHGRSNSLRHYPGGGGDPSLSDTELGKLSSPHSLLDGECGSVGGSSVTSERAIDVGRVGSWAATFEKLLEDPAGLHTFAEFLKKEYSHENIYFWTACERYKRLSSPEEMRSTARKIFERHLFSGAPEPVNVDSQARQDAQDGLHMPDESLFAQAQKQIFNLMKFDSYSRFLKSTLYQDCMTQEMRGQPLPYPGDDTLDPDLRIGPEDTHVKLKKSRSDADERRRKSLLPWSRKDRSKSKDRGEAEYRRRKKHSGGLRNNSDSSSLRSDVSGSRTSLNSSTDLPLGRRAASRESLTSGDLGSLSGGEGSSRCRVILPDLTNSVVALKGHESIQDVMTRLLERRGLTYSTFEVYLHKSDKILNKEEDSLSLGGAEVRLEQRVFFRLDLPTHKTVCVKAKPTKTCGDVLKPILQKYGLKLDLLHIHKDGEDKLVNIKAGVTDVDGCRLVVQTKEEVKEWGLESGRHRKRGGANSTLDEITNRVFEDLRNGKTELQFDDMGIMDLDAHSIRTDSSDKSSGILGSFSRRNSFGPDKDHSGSSSSKGRKPRSSLHNNLALLDHALLSKRRGNATIQTKQENDELYEGLKRAQRSRLDDQRGTEINFELPEFLKRDQPQVANTDL